MMVTRKHGFFVIPRPAGLYIAVGLMNIQARDTVKRRTLQAREKSWS